MSCLAWLDESGHSVYVGAWFPDHGPILDSSRRLRIPGVKIFADGAGIAPRGCPAMTVPYPAASTDPNFYDTCFDERGDLYLSQTEMNQAVADLQARGFRVAFHTVGDWGIDTVLNAIEPAYAVSQEHVLGSLKPGKYADVVILSGNPLAVSPDSIKDLQVLVHGLDDLPGGIRQMHPFAGFHRMQVHPPLHVGSSCAKCCTSCWGR